MADSKQDMLSELRSKIAAVEGAPHSRSTAANLRRPARRRPSQDRAEADSRKQADPLSDAKRKIERLCNVREQCSSEVLSRLVRDGFAQDAAQEALDWAQRCGLVDDARYADVLVRSRYAAGRGLAGIERELSSAGIDPETVEQLQDYRLLGSDAELERALDLLERKPPRAKNARDAAYRRLVQKGYASSVASSAARLWWEGIQQR